MAIQKRSQLDTARELVELLKGDGWDEKLKEFDARMTAADDAERQAKEALDAAETAKAEVAAALTALAEQKTRDRQEIEAERERAASQAEDSRQRMLQWEAGLNERQVELQNGEAALTVRENELKEREATALDMRVQNEAERSSLTALRASLDQRKAGLDAREAALDVRDRRVRDAIATP